MILDPVNDADCLGQLTTMAREIAGSTLVRNVARRLGSKAAVIAWLQGMPQEDDDGSDTVQAIACDVLQRVRLFPAAPNCVERSFAAMVLFQALDPTGRYRLVTIEWPARHTAFVDGNDPIDLFPRRNFDFTSFGRDVLKDSHAYVGKPILKFYLGDSGGRIADVIGGYEDRAAGNAPPPRPAPSTKGRAPARAPVVVASSADRGDPELDDAGTSPRASSASEAPLRNCPCKQGGMSNATDQEQAPATPFGWPPS